MLSKVVPNESSSLDSRKYGNDTVHANHMGMCRFEDENDDGYEKFKGVLAKFIAEIKSEPPNLAEVSAKSDATRRTGQSLSAIWSYSPVSGRRKDTDCRNFQ